MPDGSYPSAPRGVKQEQGSWSKGWLSPPGSSSTTTACNANPGASHGPTVNNKQQHPPYWNDDPCPLVGTIECGLNLYRWALGESVD